MSLRLAPLLLLLPLAAAAETSADASLSVKPLLCIVDERTPVCDIRFRIDWESPEPGYHCLGSSLDDDPLRCWEQARSGRHDDERSVNESFRYRLARGLDEIEVASATVEVLHKDSDDRRRRRRTRYVWDIL